MKVSLGQLDYGKSSSRLAMKRKIISRDIGAGWVATISRKSFSTYL
jgi:hypothetical protein